MGGTRLIEIDYLDPDPKVAAAVVNELVQELTDYTFETRYKATESASESLSKQLAELRIRSENLQAQVAQMQRESGIYSIGTTDAKAPAGLFGSIGSVPKGGYDVERCITESHPEGSDLSGSQIWQC